MRTRRNLPVWTVLWTALAASLSGCAQPSPPPPSVIVSGPRLPPPDPRLMTPVPSSESYSARVQESLSKWAERLEHLQPK